MNGCVCSSSSFGLIRTVSGFRFKPRRAFSRHVNCISRSASVSGASSSSSILFHHLTMPELDCIIIIIIKDNNNNKSVKIAFFLAVFLAGKTLFSPQFRLPNWFQCLHTGSCGFSFFLFSCCFLAKKKLAVYFSISTKKKELK